MLWIRRKCRNLARSRSQLCIFLFWVWLCLGFMNVCGVFMWVTDGERESERAEVHVCKGRREWLCCGGLRWEEWKSAKWDHRESRKRLYEISSYKEHHHAEIKDPLWRKSGFYCCLHVCLVFLISFQTKHVQIHQSTPLKLQWTKDNPLTLSQTANPVSLRGRAFHNIGKAFLPTNVDF